MDNKFDEEYILYGERKPGCLRALGQALIAILKWLFFPHRLTIYDGRVLKRTHDTTGLSFPLKSERVNRN